MALPSRPGEVVIDAIEGDGGRLPLEAARNCAGIAAQQVLHLMGPQPCGVALTIHKVPTLNPVSSAANPEPGPPVGFLQPQSLRWEPPATCNPEMEYKSSKSSDARPLHAARLLPDSLLWLWQEPGAAHDEEHGADCQLQGLGCSPCHAL